jgi:hypothetical protein
MQPSGAHCIGSAMGHATKFSPIKRTGARVCPGSELSHQSRAVRRESKDTYIPEPNPQAIEAGSVHKQAKQRCTPQPTPTGEGPGLAPLCNAACSCATASACSGFASTDRADGFATPSASSASFRAGVPAGYVWMRRCLGHLGAQALISAQVAQAQTWSDGPLPLRDQPSHQSDGMRAEPMGSRVPVSAAVAEHGAQQTAAGLTRTALITPGRRSGSRLGC